MQCLSHQFDRTFLLGLTLPGQHLSAANQQVYDMGPGLRFAGSLECNVEMLFRLRLISSLQGNGS